ncbi:MAG: AsnC family transcriptional regulator [Pedobacter sp.]|nr:MAG: AsnC family transcriptional regulator [Pedobacter sp.]
MIDHFDKQILNELEVDGRVAYSVIAQKLGISNTMVHQRVARLQENGILKGVRPIINEKKLGYDWGAFTGLTLEKDHDSSRIIEALQKIPEVTECYFITGKYTLFVKIAATNHEHMRAVLYDKIDNIPGIAKTDSIIELGCAFKRNIIPDFGS